MEQFGILTTGSRLKRLSDHLFNEVQSVYQYELLAISATYFPILRLLQQAGERSVVEISEGLDLSHPAVSKQVAKMLKEGLVDKIADSKDQRRSAIRLSEFGQQQMQKVEPVLDAIGLELRFYLDQTSGDFLQQLGVLESVLLKGAYAKRIMLRLHPERTNFVALQKGQEKAFKDLNMAWLERYFADQIYPQDLDMLEAPFNAIEQQGCIVKVAEFEGQVIGTYLLKPKQFNEIELCKLSVDEQFMRLGVGEALVKDAIRVAQASGYGCLSLESHTSLVPALELYRKLGFRVCAEIQQYSVPRANIKMALSLKGGEHE